MLHLLLSSHKGVVKVQSQPGVLLIQLTPHDHRVVDRKEPSFLKVPLGFGQLVYEQGPHQVCLAQVGGAAVYQITFIEVKQGGVQLAADQHFANVGGGRNLVQPHAFRRLKTCGATMAFVGAALHKPFNVTRMHAKFMLQNAARPQRCGLLVLRHAHTLARQVLRAFNTAVGSDQNVGVKEQARGVNRQRHPTPVATSCGNEQRRQGHFRHIKVRVLELAPKHFGGVNDCGYQPRTLHANAALGDGTGSLVVGEG